MVTKQAAADLAPSEALDAYVNACTRPDGRCESPSRDVHDQGISQLGRHGGIHAGDAYILLGPPPDTSSSHA